MDKFTITSTSPNSGQVAEETILDQTSTTRKIFRAMIVRKPGEPKSRVKGAIIHQRKGKNDAWEDLNEMSLSSLKSGEGVKLDLTSDMVAKLCEGLDKLKAVAEEHGVMLGVSNIVVGQQGRVIEIVDSEHRAVIEELIARDHGEEFWDTLRSTEPEIVQRLAYSQIQRDREGTLAEFRQHLDSRDWNEGQWEDFFARNEWIFGYGLDYCFLGILRRQANYGGVNFTRKGEQKGEFLTRSAATTSFTTLVEIKRPDSLLFDGGDYRNGVPNFSSELVGGISQVQINTRTWDVQGSRRDEDREILEAASTYTIDPEAILVIGDTAQLDTLAKRNAFALMRSNLKRPKIVTFDELYERASHIVSKHEAPPSSDVPASESDGDQFERA